MRFILKIEEFLAPPSILAPQTMHGVAYFPKWSSKIHEQMFNRNAECPLNQWRIKRGIDENIENELQTHCFTRFNLPLLDISQVSVLPNVQYHLCKSTCLLVSYPLSSPTCFLKYAMDYAWLHITRLWIVSSLELSLPCFMLCLPNLLCGHRKGDFKLWAYSISKRVSIYLWDILPCNLFFWVSWSFYKNICLPGPTCCL